MAAYTGIKNKFAVQIGSAWGTLVDATTGDLYPIESENLASTTERIANNELNDTAMRSPGNSGQETVGGTTRRALHYQGDEKVIAIGLGTAGNPVQVGTTGYYTHTLIPAGSLEGIFASLFSDRENDTIEIDSAKVESIRISGRAGERVMIEAEWIGRDFDTAGDLTWGSATEATAAALNYVLWGHLTFQFAATQGSAVDTEFYPESFEIMFKNNLARYWTTDNYPNIDEPLRDGFAEITGSFVLPHDEANPWITSAISQTPITMSIDAATGSYSLNIDLPYVVITSPTSPVTEGPGRQPVNVAFTCEKAASNPTGMASTLPHIVNVNQLTTNPLA